MSIKSRIRKAAQNWGVEINRFNPLQSHQARLQRQLMVHGIDLVVDVGANDGGYGRVLRETGYLGHILSFEPLQIAHKRLSELSAADKRWHIAPRMALGDADCQSEINVSANSTSSSLLPMLSSHLSAAPQSKYERVESISVRRLDGVDHPSIANASRVFVKLDVQGFELAVLQGAAGLLRKISGFQLECSLLPLYERQTLYSGLFDWMQANQLDLWDVIPGFTDAKNGRMLQMDCVFFRHDLSDSLGYDDSRVGDAADVSS